MSNLFFPKLTRRKTYRGNGGGSKYTDFHAEIEADCEKRCVYCDAALGEIGFEGMQLDHFRPQKHFPTLVHEPTNLVLGCAKCNRSKWYHWPSAKTIGAPSHDGQAGFVDPFLEDRLHFFRVKADGEVECLQGPATYMVKLLKLNRKARVQVRRMRLIRKDLMTLTHECVERTRVLVKSWESGKLDADDAMLAIKRLENTHAKLLKLQVMALKL